MVDGGHRPDGPCHGRAEELTREGTEGIGGRAISFSNAASTLDFIGVFITVRPCNNAAYFAPIAEQYFECV